MELQAGQSNRYRIIARLCSGGMADIYLGIQVDQIVMDRLVVIKKVHSGGDIDDETATMFADEARIISTLNHPHVVQIFDFAEEGGDFILVMEYIDGENLGYVLSELRRQNTTMPRPIVFRLISQALEALQYIHTAKSRSGESLRIVHRDLDPRNLMIDRNGYLKIIDFGVAKAVLQTELTAPGLFKGKLSHVAPELITHQDVDNRADIYAIGLVLFEMMVGQKPYHFGKDVVLVEAINRIVEDPIPKPSSLNPNISPAFDNLILRACAKDRNARFSSAKELQRAIETTLRKEKIEMATNAEVQQWFAKSFSKRLLKRQRFENQTIQKAKQHADAMRALSSRPATIPGSSIQQLPGCYISGPETGDSLAIPTGLTDINPSPSSQTPLSSNNLVGSQQFSAFQNNSKTAPGINRDSLMNHSGEHTEVDPMQSNEDSGEFKRSSRRRFAKIAAVSATIPVVLVALFFLMRKEEPTESTLKQKHIKQVVSDQSIQTLTKADQPQAVAEPKPHPPKVAIATPLQPSAPTSLSATSLSKNVEEIEESAINASASAKRTRNRWRRARSPQKTSSPKPQPDETSNLEQTASSVATLPDTLEESTDAPSQETDIFEETKTQKKLTEPKVAAAPKEVETPFDVKKTTMTAPTAETPSWLSGSGTWSASQVIKNGCGGCHQIDPSSKTESQWHYFFSHNRHRKYKNLGKLFSPKELKRVQSHLSNAAAKKAEPRPGIAGVRQ